MTTNVVYNAYCVQSHCALEIECNPYVYLKFLFFTFFKYKFIYFNWRLITLQYCIRFAIHQHESAMLNMGNRYTHVPHPEAPSLLPPCTIPLGHPSAPALSIQ